MINGTYDEVYADGATLRKVSGPKWPKRFTGTRNGTVLDASRPPFYRWFTGGMVNTCYNAIDRHVNRAGEISLHSSTTMRHWYYQDFQLSRVAG
jgi:hypothetical protein